MKQKVLPGKWLCHIQMKLKKSKQKRELNRRVISLTPSIHSFTWYVYQDLLCANIYLCIEESRKQQFQRSWRSEVMWQKPGKIKLWSDNEIWNPDYRYYPLGMDDVSIKTKVIKGKGNKGLPQWFQPQIGELRSHMWLLTPTPQVESSWAATKDLPWCSEDLMQPNNKWIIF